MVPIRTLYIGERHFFQAMSQVLQVSQDILLLGCVSYQPNLAQICNEHKPHLVVFEASGQAQSSASFIRELQQRCPPIKFILLVNSIDIDHARLLLQAGVTGYLLKQSALEGLPSTIRLVNAGNFALSPEVTHALFA
jgi:two-component system, NarL family, response regulator DegU